MPATKRRTRPRLRDVPPDAVINLTVRVHAEARRQLRLRSARDGRTIEEIVRSLLYPGLGLDHLPVASTPG